MASSSIATAYVQVRPSMDGVAAEVRKEYSAAGTSSGSSFGSNLTSTIKGAIKTAAIGKFLKESITAGAELEQSLGGIETLFKDSSDTVIASAQQAYKTAGMSANAYMETVTSFSASLLQGLSGDTEKAASVADMALTDMSDNANKMGTDMQLIQNAYQGFAKQNYTMLDNLKLGYGGTKTEMQRLLADAQKLTGVKYDISNLSDVYSAIHAIQTEMGISGLTAAEAAEMVAAGLMTEEEAFEALGTTAKEASTTITGSFNAMKASLTDVLGYLALGMDVTPALNALAETTVTFLAGNLLPAVWNIVTALPSSIVTFIKALIPGNVMEIVTNLVTQLTTFITTSLPQVLENGMAVISELMTGFINGIPSFLTTAGDLMKQLLDAVLATGPQMLVSGLMLIADLASGLLANLPQMLLAAAKILGNTVSGILAFLPQMLAAGISLIVELAAGLIGAIPTIAVSIPAILESISAGFESYDWDAIGTEMMNGIGRGISSGVGSIISAAKSAALSAYRSAKKALGIASPSKVMRDEIGKFIPAGIAVGIEANTKPVSDAMTGLSDLTTDSFSASLQMDSSGLAVSSSGKSYGASNIVINVYGAEGQSVEELADMVMEKLQFAIARKEAQFA